MPTRQKPSDVEASVPTIRALDGFPSLAEFIASDADHTSLVFKRFDKLAARNLLYLQSELAELQARQNEFDAQDRSFEHGGREMKECAMHWERFKEAAQGGDEKQKERMELVMEIRRKLKEYSANFPFRLV
jgi:hypothetical protein